MAQATTVLTQTLHSITLTKIRELEKQQDRYESRKNTVLSSADPKLVDQRQRIARLYQGVTDLYPEALANSRVKNVQRWLEQSKYDASINNGMLESYEDLLRSTLEIQTRKLGLARLYTKLVTEWMDIAAKDSPRSSDNPDEDSGFESIDQQKERLQDLCDKFEAVVFEPLHTDESEINAYIAGLFQDQDGEASKLLSEIRGHITDGGKALLAEKAPFDLPTLDWAIKGLLAEDLLSDEKQSLLREILDNDVVLREIADVLNMRIADLDDWHWGAGELGIPVLPRQQLNGKYRVWMDEDVIQAILIHYIGIRCCVFTREALVRFVATTPNGIWKWNEVTSKEDQERLKYYLGSCSTRGGLEALRASRYQNHFFLSQLPRDVYSIGSYEDDGTSYEEQSPTRGTQGNIKQKLLRTLASEVVVHGALEGEVAVLQSDLQWYATGLSHSTIFAVMRFFGFSESLVAFLQKVLRAPLNIQRAGQQPTAAGVRIRQRGVPMAHAIEKLIGELVLFVLDLAVNHKTGMLLYRLHDDLWLCGDPQRCADAWQVMNEFSEIFGLQFNMAKTGSVYLSLDGQKKRQEGIVQALPTGDVRVGHLQLDPKTGKWKIDHAQVSQHVAQLKKQLASCDSVLAWVRTWNSCIGRFFSHTLGEPAPCLGVEHVDSILATYQTMQASLFGSPEIGVVQHVKTMLTARFGHDYDIPDAFVVVPEELGGLGVRNPFIPVLAARGAVEELGTSSEIMEEFFQDERREYLEHKRRFELQDEAQRISNYHLVSGYSRHRDDATEFLRRIMRPAELGTFVSFDDFVRWRKPLSVPLADTYELLVEAPGTAAEGSGGPVLEDGVKAALRMLGQDRNATHAKAVQARWDLQMYRDEIQDGCGGWRLIEERFLPLGVLAMMRRKAVRWNLVL